MVKSIESRINGVLMRFAKRNPEVISIYKRHNVEEFYDYASYYVFREKGDYTKEWRDKMSELNKRLVNINGNIGVICSTASPSKFKEGLLEKLIYQRNS